MCSSRPAQVSVQEPLPGQLRSTPLARLSHRALAWNTPLPQSSRGRRRRALCRHNCRRSRDWRNCQLSGDPHRVLRCWHNCRRSKDRRRVLRCWWHNRHIGSRRGITPLWAITRTVTWGDDVGRTGFDVWKDFLFFGLVGGFSWLHFHWLILAWEFVDLPINFSLYLLMFAFKFLFMVQPKVLFSSYRGTPQM